MAKPGQFDWKRARKALKILIDDPDRTDQVFELIQALSGNSIFRAYKAFLNEPAAKRLLDERPSLVEALSDRERLESLPEGSLGRAYAGFIGAQGFSADGLEKEHERVREDRPDVDESVVWFANRLRDMHDLWHVTTGYGRDEAGETALLAFTFAQVPNPGVLLIVVTAAWLGPWDVRLTWQRYLLEAMRRGWKANRMPAADWEDLLSQPLDEVRRRLGVEPADVAHPKGIFVFDRETETWNRRHAHA